MEKPTEVTAEDARRFFVRRQLLAPARRVPSGPHAVLEVLARFGSIQVDPVVVAGRNHDLVLHARVDGYEPEWCDELYEERAIFETTNKALCFVPMSEMPFYRWGIGRKGRRFHREVLEENAPLAAHVIDRIHSEGPLSSRDFVYEPSVRQSWSGLKENAVRAVLEALTVGGEIGLARREGSLRLYDLVERLVPTEILNQDVAIEDQLRHRLLSRYRAHGLLGRSGGGGSFERIASPRAVDGQIGRDQLRQDLLDSGALHPVVVAGVPGVRLVLAEELSLLLSQPAPPSPPTVAFTPPFDAVLWDTDLLRALFDFDYTFEGFFPPAKRRWGYYVLPIWFGDRLVGRIEPRIEREADRVMVSGIWWQEGFSPEAAPYFTEALGDALAAYLRFTACRHLDWAPTLNVPTGISEIASARST